MFLVKTTGDFMLVDRSTRCEIPYNRPAVVRESNFINARVSLGQIKILNAELPDSATDEDFVKYWNDSGHDEDLAVASYVDSFSEPEKPAPKKRGRPRKSETEASDE